MVIGSMVGWWYGSGWKDQLELFVKRLTKTGDFFSIGLLFKSLFAPFRQISNDRARPDSPLDAQLRIWGDRMFSRLIGAFMRSILIFSGALIYLMIALTGIVWIAIWPLLPLLPVLGAFMAVTGASV